MYFKNDPPTIYTSLWDISSVILILNFKFPHEIQIKKLTCSSSQPSLRTVLSFDSEIKDPSPGPLSPVSKPLGLEKKHSSFQ
jgi:hypothetical protein